MPRCKQSANSAPPRSSSHPCARRRRRRPRRTAPPIPARVTPLKSPSAGIFLHASALLNRMRIIGHCRKTSLNFLCLSTSLRRVVICVPVFFETRRNRSWERHQAGLAEAAPPTDCGGSRRKPERPYPHGGAKWIGRGNLSWIFANDRYEIFCQIGIRPAPAG
jgi:hypothetical protein